LSYNKLAILPDWEMDLEKGNKLEAISKKEKWFEVKDGAGS